MNTFPDLAASFAKMKLQDAIGENLSNHPIARVWADNAYNNFGEVIKEIKEQMSDNMEAVERIIGYKASELFHELFPTVSNQYRSRMLLFQIDLC